MYGPSTSANTQEIAKQIANAHISCPVLKSHSDQDSDDSVLYIDTDIDSDSHEEQEEVVKTKTKKQRPKDFKTSTKETKNPFTFWNLFMDDSILAHILECTNKKMDPSKLYMPLLTMDELHAFLGLLIYTAVFKSNDENINDLFATDGTAREIYKLVMTRARFKSLLRLLCYDSSKSEGQEWSPKEEKLAPVTYIFNKFVENCKRNYTIGPVVTIDEQYFRADNNFYSGTHLNQKTSAHGIKIQFLCDAETNYFYDGHLCTEDCEEKEIFTDKDSQELEPVEKKPPHQFVKAKNLGEVFRKSVIYTCRRRKTAIFQMSVFYYLLDISTVNSYVLYQNKAGDTGNMEEFLKDLAHSLVLKQLLTKVNFCRLPFDYRLSIRRVLGNDAPPLQAPSDAVGKETPERNHSNRKVCRMCPPVRKRKTYHFCLVCKIPICLQCSSMVCVPCSDNVGFEDT